jgi:hypothetical protein
VTFREYIHLLAESIGLHQIPVLSHASDIRYFLAEDAVHHQLVTTLIREVYKRNHCGHLDAKIDPALTLKLLAASRSNLMAENDTDICRVRLINQIYDISSSILSKKKNHLTSTLQRKYFS